MHASTVNCPCCSWNLNKTYTQRPKNKVMQMVISYYIISVIHPVCDSSMIGLISRSRASFIFKLQLSSAPAKATCQSYSHTQPSVVVLNGSTKDTLWGRFFLSLMCSPQTLLFPVCSTSECYVSCSECSLFVRAVSAGTLKVRRVFLCLGGAADVRLRQNVCLLSPQDK